MALKLLAFGAFVAILARMGGWRFSLSPEIARVLSFRKPAGQGADESESDSGESGSREWSIGGGALAGYRAESRTALDPDEWPPGIMERWTTWLERWSTGAPLIVHETVEQGPTDREIERAELIAHLMRERARTNPALPATRIVGAAADQDDVPWGRVSKATVWRAWRELPE